MCNSVVDGETIYETPRELATLVGMDGLVWRDKNPFVNWFVGKDWHDLDLCRHRQFTLATRVHADDRPLAIRVDVD